MTTLEKHDIFTFENIPAANAYWNFTFQRWKTKFELSIEKIASIFYERVEAMVHQAIEQIIESDDWKTIVVIPLANTAPLEAYGISFNLEQIIRNTLLSDSEYAALDMPEDIAEKPLFSDLQLKLFFEKGYYLLYKDGEIRFSIGKPDGYDEEEPLDNARESLVHLRVDRIISYDSRSHRSVDVGLRCPLGDKFNMISETFSQDYIYPNEEEGPFLG